MSIRYRQTPYGDIYTIEFRNAGSYYTIWCSEHPDNPYDDDVSKCHLYSSGQVCVTAGKEPRTLDKAKAIAAAWIDGYSEYVRTGVFPTGTRRYNV